MEYTWMLLGVTIGLLIAISVFYFRAGTGILRIDHTNPEKDFYRFDVDDLDKLNRKKRLILKIDHNAKLSQK